MRQALFICLLGVVLADLAFCRTVVSLNDGWSGELKGENGHTKTARDIFLPHNWDDYYGFRQHYHGDLHGVARYTRQLIADKGAAARHFLVFDGAGTYLTVALNGKELCRHRQAGRLTVTLEATEALRSGTNELTVVCEHPSGITDMPWICGGCSLRTCESPEPIGLFRSVRYVTTGEARIAPFGIHVWHDEDCTRAFVEVEIDTGCRKAKELFLRVSAAELGIDECISCEMLDDRNCVRATCLLDKVIRWSTEVPKLYEFRVGLTDAEGGELDSDAVRTGFRSIKWPLSGNGDHRFLLNGAPVFIHGTSETDHRLGGGMAFEAEEIDARINEIKRIGFNAFREGHEPHDLQYMKKLEEKGLLWYAGFSTHNYHDNPQFRTNFLAAVEQWVKERRNSPALVIWGVQNESTLPVDFAAECVSLIRRLDPMSGPQGRPVVTCNFGGGTDWNVIQNWSGTYAGYGGTLMTYEKDLARDDQLLNGEYGAWRLVGWHTDPDADWDIDGPWSEEHHARILLEKLLRAWRARDRVCGHFLWTFFSHMDPGRMARVDEGYRVIDKVGPINLKGIYSIWGRRTVAWYVYLAYGHHLKCGDLAKYVEKPLSWWIAEGHRLNAPRISETCVPSKRDGRRYLYRINCGGDAIVDSCGNKWMADDSRYVRSWAMDEDLQLRGHRLNPVLCSQDVVEGGVLNARHSDQGLLGTFRYGRGRLRFTFPVPPNVPCEVEMYFVEPGSYGRLFDVAVNGKVVGWNVNLAELAPERNAVRKVWTVEPSATGELVVSFPRVPVNQAVVSAIAISVKSHDAVAWTAPSGKAGYPESEGLTWQELTAMVRHHTPGSLLPAGGVVSNVQDLASQAKPTGDCDGKHRAIFTFHESGKYDVVFRVRNGADPVRKKLKWSFSDAAFRNVISKGEFVVGDVQEGDLVVMPYDEFVNAGNYGLSFSIEGDGLSVREMRLSVKAK